MQWSTLARLYRSIPLAHRFCQCESPADMQDQLSVPAFNPNMDPRILFRKFRDIGMQAVFDISFLAFRYSAIATFHLN